ncbi:hypothetical protein LEMLEM_LOCUS8599 [Lemmus lemmus]
MLSGRSGRGAMRKHTAKRKKDIGEQYGKKMSK